MTKIEEKIITLLSNFPQQEFYTSEVVARTKCSKGSASQILRALANEKIIRRKVKGNMIFYQINTASNVVKQYKISAAMERVERFLPQLKKGAKKIILFGSASRGEQNFSSDLDLFVLCQDKQVITEKVKKLKQTNSKLSAIIKTSNEWSEMAVKDPEFYREIKHGITIYDANI